MTTKLTTYKFVVTVALAAAMIFSGAFAITTAQAHAVTLSQLVELFISLGIIPADKADAARAALASQSGSTGGSTGSTSCDTTFTQNLKQGSTGSEVMALQKFLNNNGFTVATSGAGSAGNETSYFGPATKAAVIAFQNAYASDVLTPVGLSAGTGYWGPSSRAKANAMCTNGSTGGNTGGNTGGTTTGMLNVSSATQPTNSLAPQGASRVPFTKFTLTNNSSSAVTVNGVTVQLAGLAQNAAFAGVTLVDDNNIQYGIAKTLNSNHQAVVGGTFTLNAGETKTFTVAGNMASSLASYAGQVAAFSVVGINSNGTVSGSLPITGAYQTLNATLSIGSVSTSTSGYDPGAAQTKNIGDTNVKFTGIKFTAGSTEDVRLYSIRWRQSGTASSADLSNVMTYVDGTGYPTTVSSDGKYYTTTFSGGLLIQKGFSKDIYIQGDITGTNVASRTVEFDIDKASDVYFVGQTYGYGVAVPAGGSPWWTGYTTTVNAGTATVIGKANEVPAQNVAVNVPNTVMGGFYTEFKGEPVSVQSMKFTIATTSVGSISNSDYPTGVSLVDENGTVVAGPGDFSTDGAGTLTLSDTVTFPTGHHYFTLKGKIPADWSNNGTFSISTTPNSSNWTNATGQISGDTVSLPGNAVTMNTMTVKAGAITESVSATPAAQTIVAGKSDFTVANLQFDATQSGEDVRYASTKIKYATTSAMAANPINCFAWDGSTRLNSTAVNPSTTGTEYTVSFDNNLIVSKGTVKTIAIKCDLPSTATSGAFSIGISSAPGDGTGVSSGQTISTTATANAGQTMTMSSGGSLTVTSDASTPSYQVVAAGTSGVTLGVLKFHATNEDINLNQVALQLTNTASSSASDLSQVTLWDGSTQVGSAIFTGSATTSLATFTSNVTVPKDSDKLITIKGNLANVGTSQAGTEGALIAVDYDGNSQAGTTKGLGTASGSSITSSSSSDTSFSGVRMFKSYPTVAETSTNGTLSVGTGVTLEKFTVTANSAGSISLDQVALHVATSTNTSSSGTTTVKNLKVYAYTDSGYSNPVGGSFTNGQLNTTDTGLLDGGTNAEAFTSVLTIPAGTTYYFAVKGDVTQVAGSNNSSGYVTTKLAGDSVYPDGIANLMGTVTGVTGGTSGNFVWSPDSTTTPDANTNDWTNGYLIPGLPTDYVTGTTLSK